MFSLECAGRPVHHQICVGCLHISLLSPGPASFIYIETRSSLEHRWTHNNMIFFPIIVLSYCVLLSWLCCMLRLQFPHVYKYTSTYFACVDIRHQTRSFKILNENENASLHSDNIADSTLSS